MQPRVALAALAFVVLHQAGALKLPISPAPAAAKAKSATVAATATATAADVAKLHKKLETVALGLEGVVSKESSAKVVSPLQAFLKELKTTLNETASPKNASAAMDRLKAAQAGMADLTKALTAQQTELMHEGVDQEMSLMLGVLMTRRGEPLEKQLEVLRSPEFSNLPVSKELLAKQDKATPLFQQVALYMDQHGQQGKDAVSDREARLAKSIAYFSKKVDTLKNEGERMKKVHDMTINKYHEYLKQSKSKSTTQQYALMAHQADREYKKRMITNTQQVKMMEDVVTALKKGDTDALQKAENALKASMKAMQAKTGSFLHLLQLGHRLMRRDCPYCAAQCIDKCHTAGNPYTQCLTTCADAGK